MYRRPCDDRFCESEAPSVTLLTHLPGSHILFGNTPRLFVSDSTNDEILALSTTGEYLGTILGDHAGFRSPAGNARTIFVSCVDHA